MITIEAATAAETMLYLDVHHGEMTQRGIRLCAILGDGWYEGEVILELGEEVEVTFADLYLDEGKIRPFLQRVGRGELESSIALAVSRLLFSVDGKVRGGRTQPPRVVAYRHEGCTFRLPPAAAGRGRSRRKAKAAKAADAA